ncbi:MAG: response regulator [Deltaproteobacteria bacterium]|nr:response regulator [Deltaproteobacteria bacterium]
MDSEKILVVDDHRDSLDLLKTQLKFLGWEVVPASNGREALEKVRMKRPNLVVLDMLMPEIDGFQVARLLKSDPDWRRIPILAATALAMPGDRERCLAAGCDDYLSKPFTHRELKEHIARLLARSKLSAVSDQQALSPHSLLKADG